MTMNVDAVDAAKRILLGEVCLVKNRHGMYMAIDIYLSQIKKMESKERSK